MWGSKKKAEDTDDMKQEWIVTGDENNRLPNPETNPVKILASPNGISMRAMTNQDDPTACIQRVMLPKTMKVLPWHTFFVLAFAIACSAIFYITLFTRMGFGYFIFDLISDYVEEWTDEIATGLGIAAFLFYVIDCYYWGSSIGGLVRRAWIMAMLVVFVIVILTQAAAHPYAPISLYMILTPIWMFTIKNIFYPDIKAKNFIVWLSGPLLFVGTQVFVVWLVWTTLNDHENEWDNDNPVVDIHFILWSGPFLVSLGLGFLSFFSTFMRGAGSVEAEALNFAKIWVFLLFGLWVSASLSGAGAGVSTTLTVLTLSSFAASAVFLAKSFSKIEQDTFLQEMWNNIIEKYGQYMDVARGLLVLLCSPLYSVYFFVSFLKQQLRNLACLKYERPANDTKSVRHIEGKGWVTLEARRLVREYRSWDRTSVLTYTIYW